MVSNSVTPGTVAHQAPLSMGKNTSGLSCPPLGDLPDPGIELRPLTSLALATRFFTTSATRKAYNLASTLHGSLLKNDNSQNIIHHKLHCHRGYIANETTDIKLHQTHCLLFIQASLLN